MRESDLLSHIYARSADLPHLFPQVLVGPGHDCAVIRLGNEQALLKVDQLIASRHFRIGTPIDLIARKAIARPLSDIAAAGGSPLAALAAATLPTNYKDAVALFDAMAKWAAHFACPLVGGDVATSDGPLTLSVSIIGRPHPRRGPVLRSGAQPGDNLYITGTLGGSLDPSTGLGHHLTFEPRLREARFLCDTLGSNLHAMMDISDGLGLDASRLARASDASITIDQSSLPMTPGVADWRRAVADGEDYELLFAAAGSVPAFCPETGTPITRIGRIEPGPPRVELIHPDQKRSDISTLGWDPGNT